MKNNEETNKELEEAKVKAEKLKREKAKALEHYNNERLDATKESIENIKKRGGEKTVLYRLLHHQLNNRII